MAFLAPIQNPPEQPQPAQQDSLISQLIGKVLQAITDPYAGALIGGPMGVLRGQASKIFINPSVMDPQRFMTVTPNGLPWAAQKFPNAYKILVEIPGNGILPRDVFEDGIKGLNPGHALRRAADNWPYADAIRIIGKETP